VRWHDPGSFFRSTNEGLAGTPAEGSVRAARKNLLPNRDRILF
jgi:hypothetical protein